MKIIALEVETPGPPFAPDATLLRAEALAVWRLQQEGFVREIHFRADRDEAVLILEADSATAAESKLAELPLVATGRIFFDLIPLRAYPGFGRLFEEG